MKLINNYNNIHFSHKQKIMRKMTDIKDVRILIGKTC